MADMQSVHLPDGTVLNFPAGMSQEDMGKAVQGFIAQRSQPAPSTGQRVSRDLGYVGKGFNESMAETLGALPDAVNWATQKLTGWRAAPPGYYADLIKSGLGAVGMGGPQGAPQNTEEKLAYGGGRGVADAASIFMPAVGAAKLAKAGSVTEGALKTLAAQPIMQAASGAAGGAVGEATDSPLLGLAASLAVPLGASAAKRVITPLPSTLSPEQARLARVATAEGIPLTVGQATGSRPMQVIESTLQSLPGASGMAQRQAQAQREAFNRAVLDRAGIQADQATPDVIDARFRDLSHEFDRLTANTTISFDRQFANDIRGAVTTYNKQLPPAQKQMFYQWVNEIVNRAPAMDGKTYQNTRSTLNRMAGSLAGTDPLLSNAYKSLRDALDNAAGRSISPDLQASWQDARAEYRNLKTINKAMQRGAAGASTGDIPPANLFSAQKAGVGVDSMARGRGDLNDLARIGQAFIKPQIPNSGTPERLMWTKLLTLGALGAGPGAATIAAGLSHPITAGVAAAGMAMPAIVQKFLQSEAGRRYMTNQLLAGRGPKMDAALVAAIASAREKNLLTAP